MNYPIPVNEERRIVDLKSYSLLDSLPEEDYDFITSMASNICETPIALISLVDEDRQWFKSKVGLSIDETPREFSFCAHAICKNTEIMVVPDACQDERFVNNPLVTGEPKIRFYAGVPLNSEKGFSLGTLCIIDTKPRQLNQKQLSLLESLSRQVINLMELRRNKKELEKAYRFLRFKNKELEEFTYITSHDLQEPVRTIISLIEMVSFSYDEKLDDQGKEMMKYIVEAGGRMQALIMGLLDYSRLGKEKTLDLVECDKLVDDVILDLSKSISDSNGNIQKGSLPKIVGYKTDLRMLFQNLISNALKFRHPERDPVILIEASDEKDHWKFCITDNGIGIEKKYRTRIFKIFQRLHSRELYEGYGLGLTHCRKIIELHNGKIWVNSNKGTGSKFYFNIPKVQ